MTRPHIHSFRCTAETAERLKAAAQAADLAQGDFIAQLLDRYIPWHDAGEDNPPADESADEPTSPADGQAITAEAAPAAPADPVAELADRIEQMRRQLADRIDRADRRITRLTDRADELEQRTLPPPEEFRPPEIQPAQNYQPPQGWWMATDGAML